MIDKPKRDKMIKGAESCKADKKIAKKQRLDKGVAK